MKTLRDVLDIVDDKTNVELYIKGEKSFNEDGEEMDHRWIEFIPLNGKFYATFEETEFTDEEIQKEVESLLDYKVYGMTSLYDDNTSDEYNEDFELEITPWLHLDIVKCQMN